MARLWSRPGKRAIKHLVRNFGFQYGADRAQGGNVDSGGKAHAFAQIHEILEHDIARRTGRKGATAQSRQSPVKNARAVIQRGCGIGDTCAPRVMQMHDERPVAAQPHHAIAQRRHLPRSGIPHSVGDPDDIGTSVQAILRQTQHFGRINRTCDRAT